MGKSLRHENDEDVEEQVEEQQIKKRKKGSKKCADDDAAGHDIPDAKLSEESEEKQDKKTKKKKKTDQNETEAARTDESGSAEANKYREEHSISAEGDTPLPDPFASFDHLPFHKKIVSELKKAGFTAPSPIQAQGWPIALQEMDLIAIAKTGSGKTLAFLLPVFHLLSPGDRNPSPNNPEGLVLAPTRELAMQIKTECDRFGACIGVKSCCIYGGVPLGPQKAELNKMQHIVIATPGRLNDMLSQKALSLKAAKYLVLDEADRMLDMGFEPQIKSIMAVLPEERQTLFFTATWPKAVRKLAKGYLRGERLVHITVGNAEQELEANRAIVQEFHQVTDDAKDAKLWKIIQELPKDTRMVCFANTKRRVDYLAKALWDEGLGTCAIHGDRTQAERDDALRRFASGEYPLMFATDVAARGLDIKGVTHVLNFDMARDVESYVHRIGRTGRAGLSGTSITFWNPDYDKECAPALAKIARDAGCAVPDWLERYASGKASKQWKPEDAVLA